MSVLDDLDGIKSRHASEARRANWVYVRTGEYSAIAIRDRELQAAREFAELRSMVGEFLEQ